MTTLHIEHAVRDFDIWKAAFDGASALRAQGGVRRYVISRPVDQLRHVMIDLEFDDRKQAEAYLSMLEKNVWQTSQAKAPLDGGIQTRILEQVEARVL